MHIVNLANLSLAEVCKYCGCNSGGLIILEDELICNVSSRWVEESKLRLVQTRASILVIAISLLITYSSEMSCICITFEAII